MDTLGRLTAPAGAKFRQLQKMVQDIKKNDGSLIDKLRRLKSKPTPKVPARDYQDDMDGNEQWSEAEFESDTYEDPLEDLDDSYEPPPSHRVFTPTTSNSFSRGEYVDSCRNRPNQPPRKPLRPAKTTKPLPPEPRPRADDDEDYINPDSDDNYIDPTEKPPPSPLMHGRTRAVKTSPLPSKRVLERLHSPDLYEVPDHEENSLSVSSLSTAHRAPSQSLPPRASPRMNIRKPSIPVQEPQEDDDEYEVCHPDDGSSTKSEEDPIVLPKPKPREKLPKPTLRPRPDLKHKKSEAFPTVPTRHSSQKPSATAASSLDFKRPKIPLPHLFTSHRQAHRGSAPTENGSPDTEKEADLYQKPWYASTCDRKTAEDALIRSDKDGSFLVRKSSGQDIRQPYTLVVLYNNRVYNIPVRYVPTSQQYALGKEKKGEERFSSVSHIIKSHQRNPLVLIDTQSNTKDATTLCHPVRA